MPTIPVSVHDADTAEWIATGDHDDRVCRAIDQAADLVRSIEYGRDYTAHFINRLNEHLQATGITLPARIWAWDVSDDGDGGFIIKRVHAEIGGGR